MSNSVDKLNIEKGSAELAKKAKERVPVKPKFSESKKEDTANIDRDTVYKKTQVNTIPHETLPTQTTSTEIPLTIEQKQNIITGMLKKNNIDPEKYPVQIKNLANRVWTLKESTIMEIISDNNKIAKLGEEKWIRGKIFSVFWFSWDKIA